MDNTRPSERNVEIVNQDDNEDLQLFPPWKEAVRKFLEVYNEQALMNSCGEEVIRDSWFFEAFHIEPITAETPYKEGERRKLQFLDAMSKFTDALLQDHQIHLQRVLGVGYSVLPPKEHVPRAYESGWKSVRKELKKMMRRVTNANLAALTNEEKRESADLAAKAAFLVAGMKSARRLPPPSAEQ